MGKVGDLFIETKFEKTATDKTESRQVIMNVNLGKEFRHPEKGLERIYNQCMQLNVIPNVSLEMWNSLEPQIRATFLNKGVPVATRTGSL